jgi:hypothetical protein
MLFAMVCNARNADCQPRHGGYYITEKECEKARKELPHDTTDSFCIRVAADPS